MPANCVTNFATCTFHATIADFWSTPIRINIINPYFIGTQRKLLYLLYVVCCLAASPSQRVATAQIRLVVAVKLQSFELGEAP